MAISPREFRPKAGGFLISKGMLEMTLSVEMVLGNMTGTGDPVSGSVFEKKVKTDIAGFDAFMKQVYPASKGVTDRGKDRTMKMKTFKTGKTYYSLPNWRSAGRERIKIIGRTENTVLAETTNGMRRLKIHRSDRAEYVYPLSRNPKCPVIRADEEDAQ